MIERKNEVVISVNDTIQSFFTNLYVHEMQDKPDMLYLGKKEHRVTVTIPTDKPIKILGGDPFLSFFYEIVLEKGDSLFINTEKIKISQKKQIFYPIFKILNGDRKWCELNFDYLLYKKNLKSKAIEIDTTSSFLSGKWHPEKMLDNSIKLLDSLRSIKEISQEFYLANKLNHKIKFITNKVRGAKTQNKSLIIEDLGIKLNREEQLNNKVYLSFLRAVILYTYFKEEKRVSNSVQFDFIYKNKTFLKNDTKLALLDSYLKSIFLVEKKNFKKYLDLFNTINTNEALKNKWISIRSDQNTNNKKINQSNRNIGILIN
ncbi:MAG: hypothetical protein JKY02_04720, partial [Flavobacteriaceae bacterium]|nr:hypothetical protein [Flavobacteriaceae bacterium]